MTDVDRLVTVKELVMPDGIPRRTTIPALAAIIGGVIDLVPDDRWLKVMAAVRELIEDGGPS